MASFTGIPQDAIAFYRDLQSDNTREFWAANKARYAASVREPLTHLVDLLADEFGPAVLFRPYRDVRFSADKSPYKDHQGAFAQTDAGMGWYLQLSADGLMVAGGFHAHAPDQVARLRTAVDAPGPGEHLVAIVDDLNRTGWEIGGERLKTRPRGVPPTHPRLELMRHKSLTAARYYGDPPWLQTAQLLATVQSDWSDLRPLVEWLSRHVGPSTDQSRSRR